ncbi:hypothetical protein [Mesorhizobium jarvisii]|uniref:hypothetical protein n=1 Tax=Mesorhizobium jarvisii TaxID=1777867 RepID=UPI001F0AA0E6|nr:hypothetical protein [Mesorhizobium jarvisii]MCH4559219.1 hypothetical protein [Mesorhizobium jarvisii]
MILISIVCCITAIGLWLLFTLAVFALPFFAGVAAGMWSYDTGAGWLGALVVAALAAALTLGIGQFLLVFVKPFWARTAIVVAFVGPAALAGYHAVHGVVKHAMPSEGWQIAFSILGAIAIATTTVLRIAGTTAANQPRRGSVSNSPERTGSIGSTKA